MSRRSRAGLVLCALLSLAPLARGQNNPDPSRADKAALGRLLFFDKRLSRDKTVSCSTCHDPHKGWTDRLPVSVGVGGKKGKRNAQTILNAVMYYKGSAGHSLFWDGRASSLEEQAIHPLLNPLEMATSKESVVKTIAAVDGYQPYFRRAFGDDAVNIERVGLAIAEFEKTLISMNAPYDRYDAGDKTAISTDAAAGFKLFIGKGTCTACHSSALFSDVDFHNIGVGQDKKPPDMGRFEVTKEDRARGQYRTPTLRNLRYTAPYMHDGSLKTLREVIDFYDKGGLENEWLDPDIQPLHLTEVEKRQLLAFMEALNSDPLESDPPKDFPR